MPRPSCARRSARSALREHLEDAREHLRRDADAGVAYRDRRRSAPPLEPRARSFHPRSVYLAALFSRFANTWLSRTGSASSSTSSRGFVDDQLVAGRVDQRPARLDGARDHLTERDALQPELDLAAGDARDLQQVVDQPDHVVDLPVHDLERRLERSLGLRQRQRLQRVANRRERIAQLVRQRGQELVLAPVGLLQRGIGALAGADVARDFRGADDAAALRREAARR